VTRKTGRFIVAQRPPLSPRAPPLRTARGGVPGVRTPRGAAASSSLRSHVTTFASPNRPQLPRTGTSSAPRCKCKQTGGARCAAPTGTRKLVAFEPACWQPSLLCLRAPSPRATSPAPWRARACPRNVRRQARGKGAESATSARQEIARRVLRRIPARHAATTQPKTRRSDRRPRSAPGLARSSFLPRGKARVVARGAAAGASRRLST